MAFPSSLGVLCLLLLLMGCAPDTSSTSPAELSDGSSDFPDSLPSYGLAWEDRIEAALAPAECESLEGPSFGGLSYSGPLIDAHWHISNLPEGPDSLFDHSRPYLGEDYSVSDIQCLFEQEGILGSFAFYPVFLDIQEAHLEFARRATEQYPGLLAPFIMPPESDDQPSGFPTVDAERLSEMLSVNPGLFRGYGEIGLYARGDHGGPKGALALPPDSKRLSEIYPVVRQHHLLVYFHLGEGQQEAFERVLTENPDINFIFHGDQLIVYEDGGQNLEALDEILGRHPNAFYGVDELYGDTWLLRPEVSKEEFLAHFTDYGSLLEKDVATWKIFIERHPNQVLWGTDRGAIAEWSIDSDVGIVLSNYARAFIARLNPAVQEKFAYQNAERLLAGAQG